MAINAIGGGSGFLTPITGGGDASSPSVDTDGGLDSENPFAPTSDSISLDSEGGLGEGSEGGTVNFGAWDEGLNGGGLDSGGGGGDGLEGGGGYIGNQGMTAPGSADGGSGSGVGLGSGGGGDGLEGGGGYIGNQGATAPGSVEGGSGNAGAVGADGKVDASKVDRKAHNETYAKMSKDYGGLVKAVQQTAKEQQVTNVKANVEGKKNTGDLKAAGQRQEALKVQGNQNQTQASQTQQQQNAALAQSQAAKPNPMAALKKDDKGKAGATGKANPLATAGARSAPVRLRRPPRAPPPVGELRLLTRVAPKALCPSRRTPVASRSWDRRPGSRASCKATSHRVPRPTPRPARALAIRPRLTVRLSRGITRRPPRMFRTATRTCSRPVSRPSSRNSPASSLSKRACRPNCKRRSRPKRRSKRLKVR
jgi:hypothetical protein